MTTEATGAMFDEFSQGGLLDDADVTLKAARWANWDYNGTVTPPVLALRLDLEDGEGNMYPEYLSAGDLKFFVPSSDGMKAVPVGTQTKLNQNTNAVAFIISLMNADTKGELAAKIKTTDSLGSIIDGVKLHVIRKAQPKRASIAAPTAQPGKPDRPQTRLEVDKILAYPGQAAPAAAPKAAATTAAAPAAAAAAPTGASAEIDDQTQGVLVGIIGGAGGSIKVANIAGKIFNDPEMKALPAPVRNAIVGLVVKPAFLGADGRPWVYDPTAGTVSFPG